MTYFWPEGRPITVEIDALWTPLQIRWDGQVHPVQVILDRWRVDERWWRGRVWREYFTLITRTGMLVDVYHNLLTHAWYVQRLYD